MIDMLLEGALYVYEHPTSLPAYRILATARLLALTFATCATCASFSREHYINLLATVRGVLGDHGTSSMSKTAAALITVVSTIHATQVFSGFSFDFVEFFLRLQVGKSFQYANVWL